jgi:phage shock protein PspC (stress-responsive transcriptional regulator)
MIGETAGRRGGEMFYQMQHSRRMLCGVCAELADRGGLPVWLARVIAVILLLMHPPLVVALYLVAAIWMRRERAVAPMGRPAWDRDGLTERFTRLDRRLEGMERAAMDREIGLRRAFRDLEK